MTAKSESIESGSIDIKEEKPTKIVYFDCVKCNKRVRYKVHDLADRIEKSGLSLDDFLVKFECRDCNCTTKQTKIRIKYDK